jgi:hypothetical protein
LILLIRPELLAQNPLGITNNRQNIFHFSQDFVANTHSDFFKGQTERGLFYLPNHSEKTQLALQEKEKSYH